MERKKNIAPKWKRRTEKNAVACVQKKTPNQIDVETFENISKICMKSGWKFWKKTMVKLNWIELN